MPERKFNFTASDLQLLAYLTSPKAYYGAWENSFTNAGASIAYDGTVNFNNLSASTLDIDIPLQSAGIMPVNANIFEPTISEGSVGPAKSTLVEDVIQVAEVGAIEISHLLQSGGVLVRSRRTNDIELLQFGEEGVERTGGNTEESKIEFVADVKTINIPRLSDYTDDYDVIIMRDTLLEDLQISEAGKLKKTYSIVSSPSTDVEELLAFLTQFLDQHYLREALNAEDINLWRGKRRGKTHLIPRLRVAREIVEAVVMDNIRMKQDSGRK